MVRLGIGDKGPPRRHNVPAKMHEELDPRRSRSFSRTSVRACWLGFIALHLLCLTYFAIFSLCYWNLPGTYLEVWFCFYNLGLGPQHDHVISVVHGCLAAIHLAYLLWMFGWSIKKRRLVFAVYNLSARSMSEGQNEKRRWMQRLSHVYNSALSKGGVLGVDGPYFDLVLLCREVVETALQTQQAYRISMLLPRTDLTRGYAALLVLNCWSTAIVHSVFHVDAARRRLLAVVCDCALDLVTSVGITSTLLGVYYADFDFELSGFPANKWYEDVWVVHVLSEFQILLVSSWGDLTLRVVFAVSMLSNMNSMKKLLTMKVPEKKQFTTNHRVTTVLPFNPSLRDNIETRTQSKLDVVVASESRFTQILFFTWGAAIIVLHLYAESIPGLPQCAMQVKPWMTSESTCSLLVFDCYESGVSGAEKDAITQWSGFDPTTTVRLVIRHCPSFEVPNKLLTFSRLKVLKLYNTTISNWDVSAAISQIHHPHLSMLYLVRVNMTDGMLPAGLLGDDFPQTLADIEFHTTNLRALPDDFDLKWPQFASIYFENCHLSEVPLSLARLAPYDLSLAGNPISKIPAEILESPVGYLHIGSTLVSELPKTVKKVLSSLIRVDNTNVSFFWDWIDPIATAPDETAFDKRPILAANSQYCLDLQRIYNGEQTNFSAPWREGQSILLSDSSKANWKTLKTAVSCEPWPSTWYPLDFEDEYSGIKVV